MTTHLAKRTVWIGGGFLAGIALMLVIGMSLASRAHATLEAERTSLLTQFVQTAEEADRNDINSSVAREVPDCAFRGEFDTLLARFPALSRTESTRLLVLFGTCANRDVELKRAYTDALRAYADSYDAATKYQALLFRTAPVDEAVLSDMLAVIDAERSRATLMHEQVALQSSIIAGTAEGGAPEDAGARAQTLNVSLAEANTVADAARTRLAARVQ